RAKRHQTSCRAVNVRELVRTSTGPPRGPQSFTSGAEALSRCTSCTRENGAPTLHQNEIRGANCGVEVRDLDNLSPTIPLILHDHPAVAQVHISVRERPLGIVCVGAHWYLL